MALMTNEQLSRFSLQGERDFHKDFKCLIDRISLDIQSGVSIYELYSSVADIRRITYRGIQLYPISHRELRTFFDGTNPSSRPTNYVFNNFGNLTIKLYPTPVENLSRVDMNLFDVEVIREKCIVEFYTIPDGIRDKLPEYFRR